MLCSPLGMWVQWPSRAVTDFSPFNCYMYLLWYMYGTNGILFPSATTWYFQNLNIHVTISEYQRQQGSPDLPIHNIDHRFRAPTQIKVKIGNLWKCWNWSSIMPTLGLSQGYTHTCAARLVSWSHKHFLAIWHWLAVGLNFGSPWP